MAPKSIVFVGDGAVEVLDPDQTNGAYANFGFRIPVTRSRGDSPRTAVMIAYRLVVAVHEEENLGYQPSSSSYRQTDFYNLFVASVDFVLRKNREPNSCGRRWQLH